MLLHSVAVQNQAFGADGVFRFDLGVNPLSVILINLRPLNDTGTLTNYARFLAACAAINRVDLVWKGQAIKSMTGLDAAAMAVLRHGYRPWFPNPDNTNNERQCITLPIFLGRRAYDPVSCFPGVPRGELTLDVDVDIADTGYDALNMTVETIELLDAKPKEFERTVQNAATFAATGIQDLDLPRSGLIRGMLLFGTTSFAGASPAPSWGRMQLIADGVGIGYSAVDWEVLQATPGLLGIGPTNDDHIHVEVDTGGPTGRAFQVGLGLTNHAFMNLDPLGDDAHSIDASNVNRFQLRADVETADAVRVIPIERISL